VVHFPLEKKVKSKPLKTLGATKRGEVKATFSLSLSFNSHALGHSSCCSGSLCDGKGSSLLRCRCRPSDEV